MTLYNDAFYENRFKQTKVAAEIILGIIFRYFSFKSVLDVGCGVGTWLSTSKFFGVDTIFGLEGDWVDKKHLIVSSKDIKFSSFPPFPKLQNKFDLIINLEVAEHLKEKHADSLISFLCKTANTAVLFSAAIPNQKGRGHVNEQWPAYWGGKFKSLGFICLDFIRLKIWEQEDISYWYRQNVLLFVKNKNVPTELFSFIVDSPKALVHPILFAKRTKVK